MNKKKTLILVIVIVLVVAAALAAIWFATRQPAQEGSKTLTIDVVDRDGKSNSHTVKTDAENLAGALEEGGIAKIESCAWGDMIYTVDGITADTNAEEWWALTKNGEFLNTGAAETIIADGEKYEITFTVGFGE